MEVMCLPSPTHGTLAYENLLLSSLITAAMVSGILSDFGFSLASGFDRDFFDLGFALPLLLPPLVAGASIFASSTTSNLIPNLLRRIFSSHSSIPWRYRLRFRC